MPQSQYPSISGSCSFPLPGAAPAGSCVSVPTSAPCLCSQTPSHPLCAQLCPADTPRSRARPRSTAVYAGVMQQVRATLLNLESCYRFSKAWVSSWDISRFFHLSVKEVWSFSTLFGTESSHLKILPSPASIENKKRSLLAFQVHGASIFFKNALINVLRVVMWSCE